MAAGFPIEALEDAAGEAFAAGISAHDTILYSLAVSARRFADVFCPAMAAEWAHGAQVGEAGSADKSPKGSSE